MAAAGQDHLYDKVELAGASIDDLSGGLIVISEPHAFIHRGFVFHLTQKVTGILNGNSVDFLLRAPAGSFPHIHKMRAAVGAGDVDIISYEDVVVSADGTPIIGDNINRNSINTANLLTFSGPTVTDVGTEIHRLWLPPTGISIGAFQTGIHDAEAGEEWILKENTQYLHRFTNNSGGTISAWLEIMWYEIPTETA